MMGSFGLLALAMTIAPAQEVTDFDRFALFMPYPSALGSADEPLTLEWPEGHSYAVVATAFHGGAELGTTATEDEAWEIYDQWPKTDCRCGCRGIITRNGFRLRRGGSPQKILDD